MTDITQKVKFTKRLCEQIQQKKSITTQTKFTALIDGDSLYSFIKDNYQQYPSEYVSEILKDDVVVKLFLYLFQTPKTISDDDYRKKVQEICDVIVQEIQGYKVGNEYLMKKKEEKKSVGNGRKDQRKGEQRNRNQGLQKKSQRFDIPNIEKRPIQIQNQNEGIKYEEADYNQKFEIIAAKDLKITVNYQKDNVDIKYFDKQSPSFVLQNQMVEHINKSLKEYGVRVINPAKQLEILNDDEVQIPHQQAGSYHFDPFHQVIEVRIRRKNGANLEKDFKSDGNFKVIDIDWIPVQQLLKKNQNPVFSPRDAIQKLVICVCKKRGQMQKIPGVLQCLKEYGEVRQIQDLFSFKQQQIKGLNLTKVYAHQIYKIVQRTKSINEKNKKLTKILTQKQILEAQQNKLCLKIGNSHKILRYLVYKTDLLKLQQISLINYQNLNRAVKIVKKTIIYDELWELLPNDFFFQFTSISGEKKSNGMILYGPPGTGKTEITQRLPQLIGFHLIDYGKSAADFSTSLVGQTKRMLEGLVDRARISPYIQCSLGIDEVDGLIQDRKDKNEGKPNTEGISMLLSLIGGNKAVSNLVFLTSTNHIKKIDEAMLRRFSGHYQVGRLAPSDRKNVILKHMKDLKQINEILEYLLNITSNFTGAALIQFITSLKQNKQRKKRKGRDQVLTFHQITQICSIICSRFRIKLGMYSFPQILSEQNLKKNSFNMTFLKTIVNQTLVISRKRENPNSNEFIFTYGTFFTKTYTKTNSMKNLKYIFERNQEVIKVKKTIPNFQIDTLEKWIRQSDEQVIIEKQPFRKNIPFIRLKDQVGPQIKQKDRPTIMLIEAPYNNPGLAFKEIGLGRDQISKKNITNLFIFYFIGDNNPDQCAQHAQWKDYKETQMMKPFSGRIFVELKDNPKMDFELKTNKKDETPLYEKTFLRTEKAKAVNDVAPQLIDFFTKRNVSSIFLLDYHTLIDNEAFDEKKQLEIIRQKVQEAINYNSVAIIIQADSLININKNLSQSSMGPSNSYNIANHNMSQYLMTIMKTFGMVQEGKQKWITIVARDKFLVQTLKESICWPLSIEEQKKKIEQQQEYRKRKCKRCHGEFTRKQNKDQKKCMQHPGQIISLKGGAKLMPLMDSVDYFKCLQINQKNTNSSSNSLLYIFSCCLKGLSEQGCQAYDHIDGQDKDEVQMQMIGRARQWERKLEYFKQISR